MQSSMVKIRGKQGLVLPLSFWKKLGIREGEEFVVQENAPVVTLIPKRLVNAYQQTRQPLTTALLKKFGLWDQTVWKREKHFEGFDGI